MQIHNYPKPSDKWSLQVLFDTHNNEYAHDFDKNQL